MPRKEESIMQPLFDSHVHSCHSPDSQQPFDEIFPAALAKGLSGITITDHADMWFWDKEYTFREIAASVADAKAAARQYEGRLRVFHGVELAEYGDDPAGAARILSMSDYDVVLGSVHCLRYGKWSDAYSRIAFDEASASASEVAGFMEAYFHHLLDMAQNEDFDVLTHLTCPLRYINGKYHRGIDVRPWADRITEVLETIIRRGKALELNTSGMHNFYGDWMPGREILEEYYALGGRMVTLASDAHSADRIANAFDEAIPMLKEIGFAGYYYFDQRKPCLVPWEENSSQTP